MGRALHISLFERVKLEIIACGGVVRDTEYGADIRLRAAFPAGGAEQFVPRLTELSAGSLAMEAAGEEFLPGPGSPPTEHKQTGSRLLAGSRFCYACSCRTW